MALPARVGTSCVIATNTEQPLATIVPEQLLRSSSFFFSFFCCFLFFRDLAGLYFYLQRSLGPGKGGHHNRKPYQLRHFENGGGGGREFAVDEINSPFHRRSQSRIGCSMNCIDLNLVQTRGARSLSSSSSSEAVVLARSSARPSPAAISSSATSSYLGVSGALRRPRIQTTTATTTRARPAPPTALPTAISMIGAEVAGAEVVGAEVVGDRLGGVGGGV